MGFYANNLFPWVLDAIESKEMAEQRRLILSQVKGKVLEIGMGTGVNLPFYPEHVREISTVEPSDAMRPRAKKRENETGLKVDWHQGKGEKMPFKGKKDHETAKTTQWTKQTCWLWLSAHTKYGRTSHKI